LCRTFFQPAPATAKPNRECSKSYTTFGSANLTSPAFASNFEAGVFLGSDAATEALFILDGILRANTAYLVFQTKRKPKFA